MWQGIFVVTGIALFMIGGAHLRRHEDSKWAWIMVGLAVIACAASELFNPSR